PVVTDPVALDSAAREIIVLVPIVLSGKLTVQVGAAFPFRPLFAEAFPEGVSTHLSLSLLNEQGLVLVNTRHPEMAGRRLPPPGGQCLPCHTGFALEHRMMRGEEGNGQLQVQGSPLALLVFTPVTVPGRRWSLAFSEPYSAITADTRQGFRAISLLLGFSLLVGVLATVVTAQYHAQRRRAEERARLTERRARMERQLLQNQQLAAIGRMTSQIAHEINTPLAALGLNVSYLQAEVTRRLGGDSPEIEEVSQAIAGEIARLKRVVSDYLRFARLPQAVPVEASLREALEGYLDFIQPEAQARGVRLEVDLGSDPAIVLLDADLFRQAFLNLVQNSLEAMTADGHLRVTLAAEGGEQVVCVADTGPGIAPEALPHIFEPFFTTKKEGTGLGLAHARRVIEQHNGSIECQSAPGQGTLFTIRLPALAPAPRAGERMVLHDNL
ncbi:MAG: ATP-binding protein, partial [Gemmataceae bacterium]|nr:ATP-binding protein [Gemmataceae bacterium]